MIRIAGRQPRRRAARRQRHRHRLDRLAQHLAGGDAAHWRVGGEQQPVREHRLDQRLDVLGHDVAAAVDQRVRLRRPGQRDHAARADPDPDLLVVAGGGGQPDRVRVERVGDVHPAGPAGPAAPTVSVSVTGAEVVGGAASGAPRSTSTSTASSG